MAAAFSSTWRASRAWSSLDDGYGITCHDLDETAKEQGVTLKRGDYIIVRTGQMERCIKAGSWDGYPGGDAPGFAFETLEWVKRTELAALASDTWGCEVRPNKTEGGINQPWHWITIPIMGMTMGEIFNLKELGRRLPRRQGLRIHVRRARDPDYRRGRLTDQSAGDQVTPHGEATRALAAARARRQSRLLLQRLPGGQ